MDQSKTLTMRPTVNAHDSYHTLWTKVAVVASCVLLSLALVVSHLSPAKGYELDIYASTPTVVWVFVYSTFGIGICVTFFNWVSGRHSNSKTWLLGLLILLLARIVLLYIPYVRGYVSWWEDHISYWGMINDILSNGHIGESNFYPITHILLAQVTLVTGVQTALAENLSTAFFSIFFVFSTYSLAGATFREEKWRILATLIAGSVLLAGPYNVFSAPNGLSILMLPFVFYLYFKASSTSYGIVLMIILLMYPFFHPLSSAVVILALFILAICRWFVPKAFGGEPRAGTKLLAAIYLLFEVGVFTMWVSSFPVLRRNVEASWQQITMGIGWSQLNRLGQSLDKINVHGIDFIILLFKIYGAEIILALISGIGLLLLLKWRRDRLRMEETPNIVPLSPVFLVCGALFAGFLLGLPGTQVAIGQQDRRFLAYFEVLMPIFTAFTFSAMLRQVNLQKWAGLSALLVLMSASALSIASLYPSPYVEQPSVQVSRMDISGMGWFVEEKDDRIPCIFVSLPPFRFSDAVIGYEATHRQRLDISYGSTAVPDHFGYRDYGSLGEQYSADRYLTMSRYDRIVYTTVWKEVGRFSDDDFQALGRDPTVSELYSNGDTHYYYVESVSP